MDKKGFIYTFDAVLAIIPVLIILVTVSSVSQGELILPSQQIRLQHQAQDTLEMMAQYRISDITVLEEITLVLKVNNNNAAGVEAAGEIASKFLDKVLPGANYQLLEINQLNSSITSKGNMEDADNVAVGSRSYGNYSFKLYVWDTD
ncbi:MAG: hypothetical protein LLF83_03560 [Methanobacterium sp.]|nr:hypothetical protein [Methanobacterium sp.]